MCIFAAETDKSKKHEYSSIDETARFVDEHFDAKQYAVAW